MLCACSGEQFKFEEAPQSPESLATRDFSASGLSSRTTGDWESRLEDIQVDEAESTLKEALSLNYEEARALLGRLEYQRGNFDAALQVFQGIDIRSLTPKMIRAIIERTRQRKPRARGDIAVSSAMSMHSVSLLVEAILLKAKSLDELGHYGEAAKECRIILDIVESALPNGMPEGIGEDCKLEEMFHKALELLPILWIKAGLLDEAITAYRRALIKPWNLGPERLAGVQKDLASILLYGAVESKLAPQLQEWGPATPSSSTEEAILLLLVLMKKVAYGEIKWDEEIMNHLTYALSVIGQFELLADHVEQALPGVYNRADRWYFLALCYSAAGQNEAALNLLKKVSGFSESKHRPHIPSFLLGAKLCSQDPKNSHEGIKFAHKVINLANQQNQHFMGEAHKFLGVCYGNAARICLSDSERHFLQRESLNSLNHAALNRQEDPEMMYSLALENTLQRNIDAAFDNAMTYAETMGGFSVKGWKLLALRDVQAKNTDHAHIFESEAEAERNLELAAWQDLASIYTKLGLWTDAEICLEKAKLMDFHSPRSWHTTGALFDARSLHKEALVAFSVSLSIEPDYVPSIVSTAKVLMKLGSQLFPIARSFLMNALRIESMNHEAWLNLGLISKMEGSLQQAADFFQAAYELKLSASVES
ncbi:calmodulin binding protein, putative [Ricinus communis]|uniref:Calmodulin binding protein, putative n=1 Tax=Ricinus communis TaxID=3988 RepID=B9R701_RICCO|nr:calmodulin binding protein, putative [Ricinus communis]